MVSEFRKDVIQECWNLGRKFKLFGIIAWGAGVLIPPFIEIAMRGENVFTVYKYWYWGAVGLIGVTIVLSLIILAYGIRNVIGKVYGRAKGKEHSLTKKGIELPEYSAGGFSFVPRVNANWEPEREPQIEEFIRELEYLERKHLLCKECKSQLVVTKRESGVMAVMEYYSCHSGCIANLFEVDLDKAVSYIANAYRQYVRTHFIEVWDSYSTAYMKYIA